MHTALTSPTCDDQADDRPATVALAHGVFHRFDDVHFQRAAGDGTPVLVVHLADAPAALPIRAIQREFGIADDSADGIVLGMIGEALDFVGVLRIGDPFPPEVLSGNASWKPEARHFDLALGRLRTALVAWQSGQRPAPAGATSPGSAVNSDAAVAFRDQLTAAFRAAADELGLRRAEDAVAMVEELAQELAYIEYLREHLIVGQIRMQTVLQAVLPQMRADRNRAETVAQIGRLLAVAIERTRTRFNEIDAHTTEVMDSLRSLPAQRALIRSTRDFLHRSWRAFAPILARWTAIDPAAPVGLRGAIDDAYAFLAPRYMAVQDWLDTGRRLQAAERKTNQMEW
jgi:hypothetical protein